MQKKLAKEHEISTQLINYVAKWEGYRERAYDDFKPNVKITHIQQVQGTLTIGYGTTKGVWVGQTTTRAEARKWLVADLQDAVRIVQRYVTVPITHNQFVALVSHTYNVKGFSANLFRLVNGAPTVSHNNSIYNLQKWWTETYTTSKGKLIKGLVNRRKDEYNLFTKNTIFRWQHTAIASIIMFLLFRVSI